MLNAFPEYLFVLPVRKPKESAGGVALPDTTVAYSIHGLCVAAGPENHDLVGQVILYDSGAAIAYEGRNDIVALHIKVCHGYLGRRSPTMEALGLRNDFDDELAAKLMAEHHAEV